MNLTHLEAIAVVQKLSYSLEARDYERADVSIHPPFTALRSVQTVIEADDIPISLGAQDVHWEPAGAYTGEISAGMLAKLNVSYVIVGHSERRQHFGETDDSVRKKVAAVFGAGMTPIMCVGETLDEREAGTTEEKVLGQVHAGLEGLGPDLVERIVIAYEPIWAIGTGLTATSEDAQSVCAAVRGKVNVDFGASAAQAVRVQYGGSVNRDNIAGLMAQPDIDGALVGGASLQPEQFAPIVAFGRT
jgi:triosephosphate isomerase